MGMQLGFDTQLNELLNYSLAKNRTVCPLTSVLLQGEHVSLSRSLSQLFLK